MKLASLILSLLLATAFAPGAFAEEPAATPVEGEPQAERRVAAVPDVVVELSLESGDVVVQGWDRREVRAYSGDATRIELRHAGAPAASGAKGGEAGKPAPEPPPARRVSVLVGSAGDEDPHPGEFGSGNVELNVPRGATVQLNMQSGDVEVSGVAEVRIDSSSGDVDISRISKATEVNCFSGNIYVADSQGPLRLRSLSGEVKVVGARAEATDDLDVNSTSGDITLEEVEHTKVVARTVSGNVNLSGALASGGSYELKTTNGDVTLLLPANSSFRINARVIMGGEIVTDFQVKTAAPAPPRHDMHTRLAGTVGTGDADITLSSFNGTLHLRKQ